MKLKPIDQQVVVIVGANSGIGRETAVRFAEQGAQVILSGRSREALESLAQELRGNGWKAEAIPADVSQFDQVKVLADEVAERFGRIDTWVHAASVSMYAEFEDTQPEEFKRIIDVNLLGQVYGAMAALPHLKKQGRGALIHISSIEARRALPYQSAYSASKKGMVGFLDSLRMELEHDGIQIAVTNVIPASINTPLFDKALTRLGVQPAPIPPVYHPRVVAEAILYAAEHPVREIFAGGSGKGLGLLQRIFPSLGEKMLERVAFRAQKTDYPKAETAPNNLYHHIEGQDRTTGDFGKVSKPASLYTWLRTHPAVTWGLATAAFVGVGTVVASKVMAKSDYKLSQIKEGPARIASRVGGKSELKMPRLGGARPPLARLQSRLPRLLRLRRKQPWYSRLAEHFPGQGLVQRLKPQPWYRRAWKQVFD